MATDDAVEVSESVLDVFVTASRALIGIAIRTVLAAPVDITLPQHRLLVVLESAGPQTIGRLAAQLGVDQSNASRLCDRLQRLELLARTRSRSDGRAVEVSLTGRGAELLATVDEARRREMRDVLASVPSTDVLAAARALALFNEAVGEVGHREAVG